jgi:hypothetical protein
MTTQWPHGSFLVLVTPGQLSAAAEVRTPAYRATGDVVPPAALLVRDEQRYAARDGLAPSRRTALPAALSYDDSRRGSGWGLVCCAGGRELGVLLWVTRGHPFAIPAGMTTQVLSG